MPVLHIIVFTNLLHSIEHITVMITYLLITPFTQNPDDHMRFYTPLMEYCYVHVLLINLLTHMHYDLLLFYIHLMKHRYVQFLL